MSLLFLLFLSVFLLSCPVDGQVGPYIDSDGNPMKIFALFSFNKISKVDGLESLFNSDIYVSLYFVDPRLSVTVDSAFDPATMFDPQIEFVNGDGVEQTVASPFYFSTQPSWVTDDILTANNISSSAIWMNIDYRFIGDFNTVLDLKEFPYDKQAAELRMESLYSADKLIIEYIREAEKDNPAVVAEILPKNFEVIGWNILGVEVGGFPQYYPAYDVYYYRYVVKIKLQRLPDYYVNKIIVGVVLLVLISISIFVLSVNEADRIMGTLATFAGLISYLFVVSAATPAIPYSTRLDTFMTYSFFMVALMLFVHAFLYVFCQVTDGLDEETLKEEIEEEFGLLSERSGRKSRKQVRSLEEKIKSLSRMNSTNKILPVNDHGEAADQLNMQNPAEVQAPAEGAASDDHVHLEPPAPHVEAPVEAPEVPVSDPEDHEEIPAVASQLSRRQRTNEGMNAARPHLGEVSFRIPRSAVHSSKAAAPKKPTGFLDRPGIRGVLIHLKNFAMSRNADYMFGVFFTFAYLIGAAVVLKAPLV